MITGFNTDIEYGGVVYHVQTEDKGLDSPLILSLVYAGGAILASKRSRYEDLIEAGFSEEILTERLKRQHRLICAAINAGRLEELKRMGAKATGELSAEAVAVEEPQEPAPVEERLVILTGQDETAEIIRTSAEAVVSEPVSAEGDSEDSTISDSEEEAAADQESVYTVHDSRRPALEGETFVEPESGPKLTLLDDDEFRAGESFTIRALLDEKVRNKEKPLAGAPVSVKILGTAFRPQIYQVKTESDGVAIISVTMPDFSSGRAAVLIRATVKGETVELRRVIHPAI
ncbi:MAG TPA: hypothetical protein VK208_16100 [Pyrinomonadaceae bacterium]|nr:hypothetical protein [Pyrinomonadaceae bacterium]